MLPSAALARAVSKLLLPRRERERLSRLHFHDAGYGYDALGMNPDWIALGTGLFHLLYERYFRVESHDAHRIPQRGPAILAANHSGMLPMDGTMLFMDVVRHTEPPRVPRPVGDLFIPLMPFFGTLMARSGVVSGTRGNVRHLLELGEMLMVFPEGTAGVGKPFRERYRLQEWHVGHAELAIRYRVPVVPVGIVGAEEQWPQLARLDRVHPFGAPWLPVPATPFPLPTHFHIHYGEPLHLYAGREPEDADDPKVSARVAERVKRAVQSLLAEGLRTRPGVFK